MSRRRAHLHGRRALVTGSAQGIGRRLCLDLAAAGVDIIGIDLSLARQQETGIAVSASGRSYHGITADLSNADAAGAAVREAIAHEGGFDILINNAGVAPSGRFADAPLERWSKTLAINLLAPMTICHAALPHLRNLDSANIVNMASISGVVASPGQAAYCASKFGLTGFSRCLDLEYIDSGVRITTVHPTMVSTRMIDGVSGSRSVPVVSPETVSKAVLDAIRFGRHTVFVPGSMRWMMEILPRLFPEAPRRASRTSATSQSWLHADRDLPV